MEKKYHPETYWSAVGKRIRKRENGEENIIAGDDEPYYRYKREKFLQMLLSVDFRNKSVLEIGCGPGGNLVEILKLKPKKLIGVDISQEMVDLASRKLSDVVQIIKIDGTQLPFEDNTFDIVFTSTVLQHNTDREMLLKIMKELARVSCKEVYLFERIENTVRGDALCLGRPRAYYSDIMDQNGFTLQSEEYINVRASYYIAGAIRKGLNSEKRKEGEPLNKWSIWFQKIALPITKAIDPLLFCRKDIAKLEFQKKSEIIC